MRGSINVHKYPSTDEWYLSLKSLLTKTRINGIEEKIDVSVVPSEGLEYGSRKGAEEFDVSKTFSSLLIHS
tara:strand:+ start:245 stop:457 length:213 start_codon:yes stop_codon:yes gene_type:complete